MKRILSLTAAAALLAGCASTDSAVKMPPTKIVAGSPNAAASEQIADLAATQDSLGAQMTVVKRSLDEAKRALDAAQKDSQRLEARANEERAALIESAKHIKTIKDRIDVIAAQQTANQNAIMQAEQALATRERDVKRINDELAAMPKQVGELQAALGSEKQKRAAEAEAAKKISADLEKEKQQRATEADLARKNAAVLEKRNQQQAADAERAAAKHAAEIAAAKEAARPAPVIAAPAAVPQPAPAPVASGDDAPVKLVAEANRMLAAGKPADAQKLFEAALKTRPTMITALVGLAACQYQLGDIFTAARTADRALDLNPLDAQALGVKGLVLRKGGDYSAASATLEKAVKADPTDARLHNYLAITYSDRKRNPDAIEHFRKAAELDTNYAEARFNLAYLLASATPPKLDEARTQYEKAVSLGADRDPDLEKILGTAATGATK